MPDQLHWSMWESYSTWLTGFALFTVLYLYNASTFLIDKTLFDWSPAAAIATAIGFFVAFWIIYDVICRAFGRARSGDASSQLRLCGISTTSPPTLVFSAPAIAATLSQRKTRPSAAHTLHAL